MKKMISFMFVLFLLSFEFVNGMMNADITTSSLQQKHDQQKFEPQFNHVVSKFIAEPNTTNYNNFVKEWKNPLLTGLINIYPDMHIQKNALYINYIGFNKLKMQPFLNEIQKNDFIQKIISFITSDFAKNENIVFNHFAIFKELGFLPNIRDMLIKNLITFYENKMSGVLNAQLDSWIKEIEDYRKYLKDTFGIDGFSFEVETKFAEFKRKVEARKTTSVPCPLTFTRPQMSTPTITFAATSNLPVLLQQLTNSLAALKTALGG